MRTFRSNIVTDDDFRGTRAIRLRQRLRMSIFALAVIAPVLLTRHDLSVAALILFACCIALCCVMSDRRERKEQYSGAELRLVRLSASRPIVNAT